MVVTFEDQQKINKFARNTSRMTELKNEIESKRVSSTEVTVRRSSYPVNHYSRVVKQCSVLFEQLWKSEKT